MSHDDFAFEPVPGLPEQLPAGERIVWQGAPRAGMFARRVFHVRLLLVYFAVLAGWQATVHLYDGLGVVEAGAAAAWLLASGAAAVGILFFLAQRIERTTVYTLTTARFVVRFGIALPMTVNIPYRLIDAVDLRLHPQGTGDIALSLKRGQRVAYLAMWPHVRPWRLREPVPMLRCIGEAQEVAEQLGAALARQAKDEPQAGSAGLHGDSAPNAKAASEPHTAAA